MRILRWLLARWRAPSLLATLAMLTLGIAFYRPYADDFCTLANVRDWGGAGAFTVTHWYTWSGRYASMFANGLAIQAGAWIAPVITAALFAAWGAALHRLSKSSALAVCSVLTMFAIAPNAYESYIWLTGSLTYLAPLVLATWCVVLVDRPTLSALIAFIAAGFSEVGGVLQLAMFGALTVAWNRRMMLPALVTAIGVALVVLAPGNAVRRATLPPSQVGASIVFAVFGLDDIFASAWPALLLAPIAYRAGRNGSEAQIYPRGAVDGSGGIRGPVRERVRTIGDAAGPGVGRDAVSDFDRDMHMRLSRRLQVACVVAIIALATARGVQVAAWMREYAAVYDAGELFPQEEWLEACAIRAGYVNRR